MDFLMLALNILFLVGSVQVARTAHVRRLPNLYWLAANFATAALGGLITRVIPLPVLGIIGLIISSLCTVMFIQHTFYRDRKSPYLYILALILVLGIFQVWSLFSPLSGAAFTFLSYTLVWGWQAFLAYQAITHFSQPNFRLVEDWIKARYWLWFSYTFVMFLLGIRMIIPALRAESVFTLSLVILGAIVQYITWVMPRPIRRFLNRNYKPAINEDPSMIMNMPEEELVEQIKP